MHLHHRIKSVSDFYDSDQYFGLLWIDFHVIASRISLSLTTKDIRQNNSEKNQVVQKVFGFEPIQTSLHLNIDSNWLTNSTSGVLRKIIKHECVRQSLYVIHIMVCALIFWKMSITSRISIGKKYWGVCNIQYRRIAYEK